MLLLNNFDILDGFLGVSATGEPGIDLEMKMRTYSTNSQLRGCPGDPFRAHS